jgi:hypothetical protein
LRFKIHYGKDRFSLRSETEPTRSLGIEQWELSEPVVKYVQLTLRLIDQDNNECPFKIFPVFDPLEPIALENLSR